MPGKKQRLTAHEVLMFAFGYWHDGPYFERYPHQMGLID